MRKRDVKTIKDLEKYYKKVRKIKFTDEITIKRLKDIFEQIATCNTYYVRGSFQCSYYRNRSIDDIIRLSKFYFPKLKVKKIIESYLEFKKDRKIVIFRCPNIRKFVALKVYEPRYYSDTNEVHNIIKGSGFYNFEEVSL